MNQAALPEALVPKHFQTLNPKVQPISACRNLRGIIISIIIVSTILIDIGIGIVIMVMIRV